MEEENRELEKNIHYIMSLVGGFLGAYALLNRCETFGSSQTSNMIYLIMNILGKNKKEVLFRIIAVFIYMGAISLTVVVAKYYKNVNAKRMSVILDIIAVAVIGFFPKDMNYVVALYPIFFVMAVQWNVFKGFNVFSSAMFTAFENGKVSAILSFMRTLVLLSFAIVVMAYIWGVTGIWLSTPLAEGLALLMAVYYIIKNKDKYKYI